ncbi:hypothetical protein ACH5RR_036439 [Cinchona calisaya]|uniref:Gag-asp_proteas domain-containing protein n=1 Tax=Cinchona calisaya TaxID=153742 RepID=A0ABD2Y735_9GENT
MKAGNETGFKPANKKKGGCFICGGPHLMRECPKREKVNAIETETNDGNVPAPTRINQLMLVSAITAEKSTPPRDGLLYVQAKVNGMDVLAMVDTGATHSFVTGREIRRLKLELNEHGYCIKAVNSEAQPVLGVASVELTLGPWSGKCSLMAVPLDNFDLILGKEFMATNKIFPIPYLDGIMIADERYPTFLPSVHVNANAIAGPSSRNDRDKRGGQI